MKTDQPLLEEEEYGIGFFFEEVEGELPAEEQEMLDWIKSIVEEEEGQTLVRVNYIFCSDHYLHQINVEYLQHDTLTDVITFPYNNHPLVEGDIFISLDRVRENAMIYGISFSEELARVMIHGVYHLCGYGDHSEAEKQTMREKEDYALKKIRN